MMLNNLKPAKSPSVDGVDFFDPRLFFKFSHNMGGVVINNADTPVRMDVTYEYIVQADTALFDLKS